MQKDYKIQVIVPVYNGADKVEKCINSLKNQTFDGWQAILIDDASKDNSVSVVEKLIEGDERFVFIKSPKNQGVSPTRNMALDMLNSEFTAFLDCDDFWEHNMLETMYSAAKKHDCDIVQCGYIYDFETGAQVLPTPAFKKEVCLSGKKLRKVYRRMMTGINMNHVCMKLIKTNLIGDLRFDTKLKTAEDLVFCIGLFKNVKTYMFLPVALYHYCRSSTSITGSGLSSNEKVKANKYAAKMLRSALPAWGINTPYYIVLTHMRLYIITISKIFRTVREKFVLSGGVK